MHEIGEGEDCGDEDGGTEMHYKYGITVNGNIIIR